VPYALGITCFISTDENQIICYQGIAMEALLPSVLADVITPLQLTRSLVKTVEVAGTRTDEQ
jgi:hypothetical protein